MKTTLSGSVSILRKGALLLLAALPLAASAAGWGCTWLPTLPWCDSGITGFGSNPGNLRMFKYVPKDLAPSRPLVVALHGCLQDAADYDDEPGWIQFADKHRFALLLPAQAIGNNSSRCFNWFEPQDFQRDQGEALSIRQMIDKMKLDHKTDPARTYVSGLSAGGAMTAVMLAAYPELFAGGAIIAGIPYGCARDQNEATTQCGVNVGPGSATPIKSLSPAQWGDLVRGAAAYRGAYPRVAIWQGTADSVVNPLNATELMK
ncbi:MAG: PHB depolymerase family esterase [Telluria sp.]|nr:PHB depolymerase family esterase [Telluria sp.]